MTCPVTPQSQIGDVGTALRVTITDPCSTVIDVSTTTMRTITLKQPNGTSTSYAATVYDGPNGVIQYITQAGDIANDPGDWQIQGFVAFPSGSWYTVTGLYTVLANL